MSWAYTVKNIDKFLVILANLTNQMRVNFKIDTHFHKISASMIMMMMRWAYTVKNIYKFLVILENLTNQMRVNFKVDTHFQGMRVLV